MFNMSKTILRKAGIFSPVNKEKKKNQKREGNRKMENILIRNNYERIELDIDDFIIK